MTETKTKAEDKAAAQPTPETKPKSAAKAKAEATAETKAAKNTGAKDVIEQRVDSTIQPDQMSVRNGSEAFFNHFVTISGGKHAGRYGVFTAVLTSDSNGNPVQCEVTTRDNATEKIVCNYTDLVRAEAGRR